MEYLNGDGKWKNVKELMLPVKDYYDKKLVKLNYNFTHKSQDKYVFYVGTCTLGYSTIFRKKYEGGKRR